MVLFFLIVILIYKQITVVSANEAALVLADAGGHLKRKKAEAMWASEAQFCGCYWATEAQNCGC